MKLTYDLHTHTKYSDGKATMEENVRSAIEKKLKTIGISDHGPGHIGYGIRKGKFDQIFQEVADLREMYPEIEILIGIEANIINPSGRLDVDEALCNRLDYLMAGYHFGVLGEEKLSAIKVHFANKLSPASVKNMVRNTDLVIKALYENPHLKVLTHPGAKGKVDMMAVAKACEETDTLMEINGNRHGHLTAEEIREAAKADVSFIIGSDAHEPAQIGSCDAALKRAIDGGLDLSRIVNLERD